MTQLDPVEHVNTILERVSGDGDRERLGALDAVTGWLEAELEEISRAADRGGARRPGPGDPSESERSSAGLAPDQG